MRQANHKIVIGICGQKGGGKGTFAGLLKTIANDKRVDEIRTVDVLFDTLRYWDIPNSRENLQKLVVVMNKTFGEGTLTNAVKLKVENSEADIVILDSIRLESDVKLLRGFKKNILLYITADPELRYNRMKQRNEKAGEGDMSYKQFQKEEQAATEILIPKIGANADYTIENNSTFEDFVKEVEKFYQKKVATTLSKLQAQGK